MMMYCTGCVYYCYVRNSDVVGAGWGDSDDEDSEFGGEENMSVTNNTDTCLFDFRSCIQGVLLAVLVIYILC